jgi:hypothetical protein
VIQGDKYITEYIIYINNIRVYIRDYSTLLDLFYTFQSCDYYPPTRGVITNTLLSRRYYVSKN